VVLLTDFQNTAKGWKAFSTVHTDFPSWLARLIFMDGSVNFIFTNKCVIKIIIPVFHILCMIFVKERDHLGDLGIDGG
jgi:hypothetical protein